MLYIHIKASSY